jgi:hypothetical protein
LTLCILLLIVTEILGNLSHHLRHAMPDLLIPNQLWMLVFVLEHLHRNRWRVNHGIKEHSWQELANRDANFGSTQLVGRHLCQQLGACFTNRCGVGVAELIQ